MQANVLSMLLRLLSMPMPWRVRLVIVEQMAHCDALFTPTQLHQSLLPSILRCVQKVALRLVVDFSCSLLLPLAFSHLRAHSLAPGRQEVFPVKNAAIPLIARCLRAMRAQKQSNGLLSTPPCVGRNVCYYVAPLCRYHRSADVRFCPCANIPAANAVPGHCCGDVARLLAPFLPHALLRGGTRPRDRLSLKRTSAVVHTEKTVHAFVLVPPACWTTGPRLERAVPRVPLPTCPKVLPVDKRLRAHRTPANAPRCPARRPRPGRSLSRSRC